MASSLQKKEKVEHRPSPIQLVLYSQKTQNPARKGKAPPNYMKPKLLPEPELLFLFAKGVQQSCYWQKKRR